MFPLKIQIQQTLQRFESHISNLSPVGTVELEVQKYVCEKYVNGIRAVGDQRWLESKLIRDWKNKMPFKQR